MFYKISSIEPIKSYHIIFRVSYIPTLLGKLLGLKPKIKLYRDTGVMGKHGHVYEYMGKELDLSVLNTHKKYE